MWPWKHDDRDLPVPPEMAARLAAYVDGELEEAERARVEAWLDRHPELRSEVEGQRRLEDWYADQPVPAPDDDAWDRTLREVEARLQSAGSPDRPVRRLAPIVAAAAVIFALLGFAAYRLLEKPGGRDTPGALAVVAPDDVVIDDMDPRDVAALVVGQPMHTFALMPGEVMAVATAEEVVIISMDAADVKALAVGAPPIEGMLEVTAAGDVTLHHMESFPVDDRKPFLFVPKDGSPMLVSPVKTARADR